MSWELLKDLANSKIVKSSYIWLLTVPLAARLLSEIDDIINLTVFGSSVKIATTLPFSWQVLFFSACFFTLANIIYALFCPELSKKYSNFSEFEKHGKTRMQIHSALKGLVWDNKKPGVKKAYVKVLSRYFYFYNNQENLDEQYLNEKGLSIFDDVSSFALKGKDSDAFYFVLNTANSHNPIAIWVSAVCYGLGLVGIGVIAVQNIIYVLNTFG